MTEQKKLRNYVRFILDCSGSMSFIRQAIIQAFNDQVAAVRDGGMSGGQNMVNSVALYTFGEKVTRVFDDQPAAEVPLLNEDTYKVGGGTALWDAIGQAVEELDQRPDINDEETSVLFLIFTDGEENASKKYTTAQQIGGLIEARQNTGRWTFTYMGSTIKKEQVQQDLKIPTGNIATFNPDPDGLLRASLSCCVGTSSYMMSRSAGVKSVSSFYGGPITEDLADMLKKPNDMTSKKPTQQVP